MTACTTWICIGEGLGMGRDAAKATAVFYLLRNAETSGQPPAGGTVQLT